MFRSVFFPAEAAEGYIVTAGARFPDRSSALRTEEAVRFENGTAVPAVYRFGLFSAESAEFGGFGDHFPTVEAFHRYALLSDISAYLYYNISERYIQYVLNENYRPEIKL